MGKFKIFGIDLQDEFTKEGHKLCVPGAPEDVTRIAGIITRRARDISDILLTMDSHPVDHIGHPGWWRLRNGDLPAEFTLVTEDMLTSGDIRPADPQQLEYAKEYLHHLKVSMIWNTHCVPGLPGYPLNAHIVNALKVWADTTGLKETVVKKGFNRDTESFGVFAAEFYNHEIGTDFNWHLLSDIIRGGQPVVTVGEARSHCVRRSVEQMVEALGDGLLFPLKKIVIVSDCMSDVPNFEADGALFLKKMTDKGVTVCTSDELDAVLDRL